MKPKPTQAHRMSKTLRVKVRNDKLSITFNAEGWYPGHTDLLDKLARQAERFNIPVAQFIGEALELLLKEKVSKPEHWDSTMRLFQARVADDTTLHVLADPNYGPTEQDKPELGKP